MSRVAWIDASVGVAGDMLLAALIDAGAQLDVVRAGLRRLDLPGWTLSPSEVHRGAFRALYLGAQVDGTSPDPGAGPPDGVPRPIAAPLTFNVGHTHSHTGHAHVGHTHTHAHPPGSEHRPYREVRRLITAAALPERVARRALAVYDRLARAEAHLHGTLVDDVVLHEVGSVDAIVDIVGCCLALEDLGVDHLVATPLPLGSGSVSSAHGLIPLPAPATVSVCVGYPVVPSRWPGEWVTPTGAALVCALAEPGEVPAMTPRAVGVGAGRRDPKVVANIVRVVLGDRPSEPAAPEVVEVACTVDDMVGEHLPPLIDDLLAAGALDAWVVPVLMKKGRPGYTVHALCGPERQADVCTALLRGSSTLGVRISRHRRDVLERWYIAVATPFGEVRVKVGGRDGEAWHASPEHADVDARAREHGVPHRQVFDAAIAEWVRRAPKGAPRRR